jgi:flagellar biosynthesis protein
MDSKVMTKTEDQQPKSAVALTYKQDDLPRVVAKGKGAIAEKILAMAKSAEIPIHQDAQLNQALSALDLNQPIPRELFAAVAQVLVFAYNLSNPKNSDKR